jgi:hypothetical protein
MQRILKLYNRIRTWFSKLTFTTTVAILVAVFLVLFGVGLLFTRILTSLNPGNNGNGGNTSSSAAPGLLPDQVDVEPDQLHPETPNLVALRAVLPYSGLNYAISIQGDVITINYKAGEDVALQGALTYLRDYGVDIAYPKLKVVTY